MKLLKDLLRCFFRGGSKKVRRIGEDQEVRRLFGLQIGGVARRR